MPLIFLSFLYLFNDNDNKRFYFLFIIGYVGMIYSHLVLTMWFTIFLIIFLLLYINKVFKKRYFFPLLIGTIVVIIFTATFTFPLIEHMIIGKWYIPVYKNVWVLPFKGFFFPDYYSTGNNLLFINFSYFIIILSFVGIYNLIFNNKFKYDKKFLLGILLVGIVSMALTSLNCFWNNVPSFFKSIQFSWRLVTFCIFCFSLFSASALDNIYNLFKKKYKYVMTLFLVVIIAIFTINNILKVNFIRVGNYNIDDPFISFDYYPINSIENIEYIKKMDSDSVSIIKGNGIVKIKENNTPYLKFKVSDIDDYVILELPRFYYLGYEITNDSGKKIKYTENKNGLIKINISKNGVYEVRYTGTIVYKISVVLKSILIFVLSILLIRFIIQKFKR